MLSISLFLLFTDWNTDIIAGTEAAVLKREDESLILGMDEQPNRRGLVLHNKLTISALNCLCSDW